MNLTNKEYLEIQGENLRQLQNKIAYACNGMLLAYNPSKKAYKAYCDYVRKLCEVEKALDDLSDYLARVAFYEKD